MGYRFGVGREAPAFSAQAADGSEIALRQYRGDWFPVLVFVPAQAPGAAQTLKQLSAAADSFWGLRGQLVAICDARGDDAAALAASVEGLAVPLVPDDGSIAQLYGTLKKDGSMRAAAFVVDRAGKIVWSGEGAGALKAPKLLAAFRDVVR